MRRRIVALGVCAVLATLPLQAQADRYHGVDPFVGGVVGGVVGGLIGSAIAPRPVYVAPAPVVVQRYAPAPVVVERYPPVVVDRYPAPPPVVVRRYGPPAVVYYP
jgi:hypothetical protein